LRRATRRAWWNFRPDLYVLKPRNAAKSNGTALVEISNRANKGLLGMFDLATKATRWCGSGGRSTVPDRD
jgi:hypothetical protein